MLAWLAIGIGGGSGAMARQALGGWVQRWAGPGFPAGTLTVNLLGCLLVGAGMTLAESRLAAFPAARLLLTAGFLGGFTTFSAFGYETLQLLRDAAWGRAMLSVAANVILGVCAVAAGRAVLLRCGGG
ncbi:MAG: fluoride efflux transporter CrcB [Planctomycetaceae bacterium]